MVTYDFYKNIYLGSQLSETAFPGCVARAEDWLSKLERTCRTAPYGENSRQMALCAVAELLESFGDHRQISQMSVGDVSVRYDENAQSDFYRQLRQRVACYLKIKRGVA